MDRQIGPGGIPPLPDFDLAKFLATTKGHVNWDVARFLARAMAGDASAPSRWEEVEDEYAALVRAAELLVAEYTGLSSGGFLARIALVSRAG